jgi:predicted RNase H-like HicB family nuclease
MEYSIIIEKITETGFPEGYFYAYIPALDLTTHGFGIEGARQAAIELITLWVEEKILNDEEIPTEAESYFSKVNIDNALLSA